MDDIAIWPCGTWCFVEYLEEYLRWMSDDYRRVSQGTPEWHSLTDHEYVGA